MKNFVQPGDSIEYSNSGTAILSGDVVVLGSRCGVAVTDIAATTGKGTVNLEGVYSLTSDTGTAYAQGDQLYWDGSKVTKTAAAHTYIGMAFAAKLSGGNTAYVRLMPHPKVAAFVADASAGSAAEINALRDAIVAAGLMASS